jgi:hypothetical protein
VQDEHHDLWNCNELHIVHSGLSFLVLHSRYCRIDPWSHTLWRFSKSVDFGPPKTNIVSTCAYGSLRDDDQGLNTVSPK